MNAVFIRDGEALVARDSRALSSREFRMCFWRLGHAVPDREQRSHHVSTFVDAASADGFLGLLDARSTDGESLLERRFRQLGLQRLDLSRD
jgi:hypothetical protein